MSEKPELTQHPFQGAVWSSDDAARLRNFLLLRTGKRLILRLRLDRPKLPFGAQGGDPGAVALAAKKIEGYEEAIANIFDYLVTPAKEEVQTTSYPHLDDDDAWPAALREISRSAAIAKEQPNSES